MPDLSMVSSGIASGVLLGGMLALTALGLSISLGVMKLVNLAHGEFLVGGAYLGLFMLNRLGLDPLLGLPIIGVVMALICMPMQRLLIAPLAGVSIILQNLYLLGFHADTRTIDTPYAARPLTFGPVTVPEIYVIGFAISVVVVLGVHMLVSKTAFGRALRASAADPTAASVLGVDVRRVHALTFGLGAACAAMGGVLIGTAFSFTPSVGATYLLTSFAVVVLGGIGNIYGTLVAGVALGVIQSLGAMWLGDGYRDLIGLLVFLLALALRPTGMVSQGVR